MLHSKESIGQGHVAKLKTLKFYNAELIK